MADITQFPIPTEVLDPANYPEFVGPQGDTGPQGPAGPEGPQGPKGDPGNVDSQDVAVIALVTQGAYDALDPPLEGTLYLIEEN